MCIFGAFVLVGTASSDILEISLPTVHGEAALIRRLVWAHFGFDLKALAVHPLKQVRAPNALLRSKV